MALMNVEAVGERLLGETSEEGMDEFLHSLQNHVRFRESPRPWFGVPALDRIASLFSPQNQGQRHPPVIEITSIMPASGKTQLLYLLAAIAILPNVGNGVDVAKPVGAVVVFDTDGRFDIERLAEILESRLRSVSSCDAYLEEESLRAPIENALKHVHVLRPQSLLSLISSVHGLPSYLHDCQEHFSGERSLELILVDSMSSYFWQEKIEEEMSRVEGENVDRVDNYQNLILRLRELQNTFACAVVVTSWGLLPGLGGNSRRERPLRSLLPAMWRSHCSVRLVVERDPIKNFPPGMPMEVARRDASARQIIVEQGKFSALVDQWNSESWSDGIWEAFRADHENRGFAFRVTSNTVEVI